MQKVREKNIPHDIGLDLSYKIGYRKKSATFQYNSPFLKDPLIHHGQTYLKKQIVFHD